MGCASVRLDGLRESRCSWRNEEQIMYKAESKQYGQYKYTMMYVQMLKEEGVSEMTGYEFGREGRFALFIYLFCPEMKPALSPGS